MPNKTAFLWILLIISYGSGYGQSIERSQLFRIIPFAASDSGIVEQQYLHAGCKNFKQDFKLIHHSPILPSISKKPEGTPKPKFLIIHGNVSYDFFYRSRIDTPFVQEDLQQHTERVWLNVLVNEKYPINVGFTARQSNSPFFRNFLDPNLQFDKNMFLRQMRSQMMDKITSALPEMLALKNIDSLIEHYKEITNLENLKLKNPGLSQKIVEERERVYTQRTKKKLEEAGMLDLLPETPEIGTKKFKFDTLHKEEKHEVMSQGGEIKSNAIFMKDSAMKMLNRLQAKKDSVSFNIQQKKYQALQGLNKAKSQADIIKVGESYGIQSAKRSKLSDVLSSVEQFSIGRTMLDYTELTAQHIMISGINVVVNPSYYAAFAAGKINYRFRDFLNREQHNNNQYLVLGRFGFGNREKRAVIFSLFQGRKSQSDFAISDTVSSDINIMGYSVEMILRKNAHSFISAEFAKSTKPRIGNLQGVNKTDALWQFSDESNMGVNIKGETLIGETNTRLSGFYRKTGENFQSFSLFSYNSNQTAWQTKVEQPFFKNRISFTGMLRQNDFQNFFTQRTYKASTIFKSALLNVRIPKYPFLSVGYYPGTQLYVVNRDLIRENAYYIVNGTLLYNYKYNGISMTSSFVYNRYINEASDSGFVLFKGINYFLNQSIFLKNIQVQVGYAFNSQPGLEFQTGEGAVDVGIRKWLRAGAAIKANDVTSGAVYWGGRLQLSMNFKHSGGLQILYEKSYLPTISSQLFPVETGRIMWFKNF